ncbi:SulP family inorganic anion transporter [Amycolatopsis rubida]|uniref:SulP family inorganic anion transporter n=1 Tax=Amycolatopsis rubida TaxID=112413 RepID=UPI003138F486
MSIRRPASRVERIEILGGLIVALALIPEAISFSVIAGVDPRVGRCASFTRAAVIAFVGSAPAMISAATGAIALVAAPLAGKRRFGYLVATAVLGGLSQIALGSLGVARLMRFVPRSVMIGFLNALAVPGIPDVPFTRSDRVVRAGGAQGIADDRQTGRRPRRRAFEQDPGGGRPRARP